MAQNAWFYTFPNGKKYEIGLFHSKDGHVVIYCQGEIMVIDFHVTSAKEYSFYIENKLVKIALKKRSDNDFTYELSDESSQPDFNITPASKEKLYRIYMFIIMAAGILFITLALLYLKK